MKDCKKCRFDKPSDCGIPGNEITEDEYNKGKCIYFIDKEIND